MDEVVFFSSRTCSDDNNYKKYLLYLHNMSKTEGRIDVSLDSDKIDKYYNQVLDEAKRTESNNGIMYNVRFTESGSPLESEQPLTDEQNEILTYIFEQVLRSSNSYDNLGQPTTKEDVKKLINNHMSLLLSVGLIKSNDTVDPFRWVYQWNGSDNNIQIYAVREILKSDDEKKVKVIRPQWCNKMIKYILEQNPQVKFIYLFLHDKDLSGYSNSSLTLIDGKDACKKACLIDDKVLKNHDGVKLSIIFFKHSNSMMTNIIGPFEEKTPDSQYLNTQLENIMEQLRGINGFKKLATKEQMKEQERELEKLQNKWINI